jgi:hypothetical protein
MPSTKAAGKAGVRKARRPQSAKAKGRNLQKLAAKLLTEAFSDVLEEGDIRSLSMGASGHDLIMSPLALRVIPFDFECKNVEDLKIWDAVKQAFARDGQAGQRHPKTNPALVVKRNRIKPLAIVPFGWLHNVLTETQELPDRATLAEAGEELDLFLDTHNAAFHDETTFNFWKTMSEWYSGAEYTLFNRDDKDHVILVIMPWPLFIKALRVNYSSSK